MRLLRLKQVMALTGYSKTTIYGYMNNGKFPLSVKIGPRATAWMESQVIRWIEEQKKVRLALSMSEKSKVQCAIDAVFK